MALRILPEHLAGRILLKGRDLELFGPHGRVLQTVRGKEAEHTIDPALAYVRARAVYTRKDQDGGGGEEYYAWGQPVFSEKR